MNMINLLSRVGAAGYVQVGAYDHAVDGNAGNLDFVGLAGYTEFLILGKGLATADSVNVRAYLSVDNGVSFFTSSGDYQAITSTSGVDGGASTAIAFSGPNSADPQSMALHIFGVAGLVFGYNPLITLATQAARRFDASALAPNAIRIAATTGNITAGELVVLAK